MMAHPIAYSIQRQVCVAVEGGRIETVLDLLSRPDTSPYVIGNALQHAAFFRLSVTAMAILQNPAIDIGRVPYDMKVQAFQTAEARGLYEVVEIIARTGIEQRDIQVAMKNLDRCYDESKKSLVERLKQIEDELIARENELLRLVKMGELVNVRDIVLHYSFPPSVIEKALDIAVCSDACNIVQLLLAQNKTSINWKANALCSAAIRPNVAAIISMEPDIQSIDILIALKHAKLRNEQGVVKALETAMTKRLQASAEFSIEFQFLLAIRQREKDKVIKFLSQIKEYLTQNAIKSALLNAAQQGFTEIIEALLDYNYLAAPESAGQYEVLREHLPLALEGAVWNNQLNAITILAPLPGITKEDIIVLAHKYERSYSIGFLLVAQSENIDSFNTILREKADNYKLWANISDYEALKRFNQNLRSRLRAVAFEQVRDANTPSPAMLAMEPAAAAAVSHASDLQPANALVVPLQTLTLNDE